MLISHDIGDGRPVTVNGPYHKGFSFLLGLNRNLFKFTPSRDSRTFVPRGKLSASRRLKFAYDAILSSASRTSPPLN